jgi:hypothetical protein
MGSATELILPIKYGDADQAIEINARYSTFGFEAELF